MTTTPDGPMPDPTGGRAEIAALRTLVTESQRLRVELNAAQAQQQWRFRWMQLFLLVLVIAVGGLVTLVLQNQEISAQIRDCTNASGRCWEDSRQRSKNNVTSILNTTIFVAECLQRFPGQPRQEAELEACVRRELATGRQPVPIPTPAPPGAGSPGPSR